MIDVTVITPSLPVRTRWALHNAIRSVTTQTLPPVAHLVGIDYAGRGPAAVRNDLLSAATTEWVAFLDDDDTFDVDHLEVLSSAAHDDVDVVIPHCRFNGTPLPPEYCNQPYDREALRRHGIFPITVLARRSAVLDMAGGFGDERYEDWSMWNRMADKGARFEVIPKVTWTYNTSHPNRRTNAA